MIEARNLSKKYGSTQAVDDVTFEVPDGKTFVLLGTSGSGKTTTLKILNRLVSPFEGQVFINGEDTSQMDEPELRRGIGFVIQNIGLFPHLNIEENIAVVPGLLKWDKKKVNERIRFLLDLLNLQDLDTRVYPDQLSGGQQQRIGIARALAADPEIVLMDEPFGALDPITRNDIREEFKKLEENINKTIVMVTHDIVEAWDLADIIGLMDGGRLIQIGSPYELTWQPDDDFVREFLLPYRQQLEMMTLKWRDIIPFTGVEMTFSKNWTLMDLFSRLEREDDLETLLVIQEAFLKYKKSRI